jgi:hypothetical protein
MDSFATAHGFLLSKNGAYERIDPPGSIYTIASGIANDGTIVGSFFDGNGVIHGFLRDRSGVYAQYDAPVTNSSFTSIAGINERGDIVGTFEQDGAYRGFVVRKGVFQPLQFPSASDTDAFNIADSGVIVGTYEAFSRGFIAYPTR